MNFRPVDYLLYLTSELSTSHSVKLLTCRLFIILNILLVDKSLYWTFELSISHSIELPTCRPVIVLNFWRRQVIVLNLWLVDKSLYWTSNLSASHCIELPTSHSIELPTYQLVVHMINQYADKLVYWLICLLTSHSFIYFNLNTIIQWYTEIMITQYMILLLTDRHHMREKKYVFIRSFQTR